jgi:hypothetical protein
MRLGNSEDGHHLVIYAAHFTEAYLNTVQNSTMLPPGVGLFVRHTKEFTLCDAVERGVWMLRNIAVL